MTLGWPLRLGILYLLRKKQSIARLSGKVMNLGDFDTRKSSITQ